MTVNVRYGVSLAKDTILRLVRLLGGGEISVHTGISKKTILDLLNEPTYKYLNIATGQSIDEACSNLPKENGEVLYKVAVLIIFNTNYQLHMVDLIPLLKYFDTYPCNPQITWGYSWDQTQKEPVSIIILKTKKQ